MKLLSLLKVLVLALVFATPVSVAQDPPAVDLMTMTRDARCKQVLVTCLVNGVPMRMMLDTGATHTVLHEESAARIPAAQWIDTSQMQFRGNSTQKPRLILAALQAGPAEAPVHPFMVMNLSAVRSMMTEKIDGILGMDILQAVPFTFDLRNEECYWGIPAGGGELVPLSAQANNMRRIFVTGKCGGKDVRMLLDTGSSVTRVVASEWAPGASGEIQAQEGNIDQAGGVRVTEGHPGDIELAPGVVAKGVKPLLCDTPEGAILGMDALQGQVLVHIPAENTPVGLFLLQK